MKRYSMIFAIFSALAAYSAQAAPIRYETPFRVVIDPGHGGVDEGTVYAKGRDRVAEKDITLKLAIEAARQLRARGFEVTLTRTHDENVPLAQRTALANRLRADAFLSIHMNSVPTGKPAPWARKLKRPPEGVETYILNNATDASSRRLAQLENSVVSLDEPDAPESMDVALILKDLRLDANLGQSKRLACSIQSELVQTSKEHIRNRGIKQALFHVLLGADMPSVLLEAGFLAHPNDRETVVSPEGQRAFGTSLANALERYRQARAGQTQALSDLSRCKVN